MLDAGALAQGVADIFFHEAGEQDDDPPEAAALFALARLIAGAVVMSWRSGFRAAERPVADALALTASLPRLPAVLATREPEGFAHYAVYPEAYAAAAAALPPGPVRVIGLRSIGTTLADVVAAARSERYGQAFHHLPHAEVAGCPAEPAAGPRRTRDDRATSEASHPAPPDSEAPQDEQRGMSSAGAGVELALTLRPVGHPFARRLNVSERLRARLAAGAADARWIVADEGPGLSGSSLAAAVMFLEEIGVAPDRIHLLPSHPGAPGPRASDAVRAAWSRVGRSTVTFDELVRGAPDPAHRLDTWCADAVGPPVAPVQEISGGAWRSVRDLPGAEWPPVLPWAETRKFLLRTASGTWLARFAGLGRTGREKLRLAQRLADAGFGPPVAGLRHGFLLQRWLEDAGSPGRSTAPKEHAPDLTHAEVDGHPAGPAVRRGRQAGPRRTRDRRASFEASLRSAPQDEERGNVRQDSGGRRALLRNVAEYLTFRAGLRRPEGAGGADVPALFAMLRHNAGEALGPEAVSSVDAWQPDLPRFAAHRRPIPTDNKLQPWEWLWTGGRLVKLDAVDHWAGHDLVGCQDIAWDLAGAAVEFALDSDERATLAAALERGTGRAPDPGFLLFNEASYCAFQLGFHALAQASVDPVEADRHGRAAEGYHVALAACLRANKGFTVGPGCD